MKEANIISLVVAFKTLSQDLFESYLKYYSINIKTEELKDLEILVATFKGLNSSPEIFDKYYIGYSIPQIGKEFDLLRIDEKSVVNIEIKKNSTPDKIKKQLHRNKYYLSFLKREIYSFTFIAEECKFYYLDHFHNLQELDYYNLLGILMSQKVEKIRDIDSFFNPSNYLVSPFNSTLEFIKSEYFLTTHQEEIKHIILNEIITSNYTLLAIKGRAGTGKTLLTYDIAKEIYQQKSVLIIHCGYLNNGHKILRDNYNWNIIEAKSIKDQDLSKFFLIIIDEAQRIYLNQLVHVISEVKRCSSKCLFSYDGLQTLRKGEIFNNIEEQIEKEITLPPFELTTKIRTNKEVASFIQGLFNRNRPAEKFNYSNIELNYFDDYQDAKSFLIKQRAEKWKIINYTPSTYSQLPYEIHSIDDEFDNAHTVIGQEFDNVVAVIDEFFYYKNDRLSTKNYRRRPYYHPTKMLFQIVSRTRIKLNIVIINNPEILRRCLEIL